MGDSEEVSKEIEKKDNSALWGSIIGTVGSLASGFNYKGQKNEIEVARLQAETAKAQQPGALNLGGDNKIMYIVGGVILLVIVLVVMKKQAS